MNWLILVAAGMFEVVWAVGLKCSHGFTHVAYSAVTVIGMVLSVWLLSVAMKTIPLGTAYTIWTGIGAVGSLIMGRILFGESMDLIRIVFAIFIVVGIVGLKFCVK